MLIKYCSSLSAYALKLKSEVVCFLVTFLVAVATALLTEITLGNLSPWPGLCTQASSSSRKYFISGNTGQISEIQNSLESLDCVPIGEAIFSVSPIIRKEQ